MVWALSIFTFPGVDGKSSSSNNGIFDCFPPFVSNYYLFNFLSFWKIGRSEEEYKKKKKRWIKEEKWRRRRRRDGDAGTRGPRNFSCTSISFLSPSLLLSSPPPFSPSFPECPLHSLLHESSSNTLQNRVKEKKKKKKIESFFIPSKPLQGKSITPLSALTFPSRNSNKHTTTTAATPVQILNIFDKNTCKKEAAPDLVKGDGKFTRNQDAQVVEFFWENGRLPTGEEVKNLTPKESRRKPTKDGVEIVEIFKKRGRYAAQEVDDLNLAGNERRPDKEQLGFVNDVEENDKLLSQEGENLNFWGNGRTPTKEQSGFLDNVDENGSLISQVNDQKLNGKERIAAKHGLKYTDSFKRNGIIPSPSPGEMQNVNIKGNRRIPIKDQTEIIHSFRKKGQLHNQKTVESSSSTERSGRICVPDTVDRQGGMPTKKGVDSVDSVEEISAFPIIEQQGISGSIEKNRRLRLLNIMERIQGLPAGNQVDILQLFRNDGEIPTIFDVNSLLISLIKADKHEYAVNLFSELSIYGVSPDARTFSIMIQCYCNKKDPDEAKRMLDEMIENGFVPNVITFTILINCFCKRGGLQRALEVFKIMRYSGCEPTIQTYNCLINGLCFVGRVEEAYELLMKIKKSSKKPDIYTFTAVMDGFCKVGRSVEGMELLEEAMEMGLKPTVVTFNTLFNGYCKEGRPLEGINLLRQMEERNCQPDFISYSTLLFGLLKWNEFSAALQIYKEMMRVGFKADERMMNALLRGLCRMSTTDRSLLKDVEELFENIKEMGCGPTPSSYCLMIQALSFGGQADRAFTNFREMIGIGYSPRTTYDALIRALCSEGRTNDAWFVLVWMTKTRTFTCRILYNLVFDEFDQQERVLDASKVHALALKRGINIHKKPREDLGKLPKMELED